MLLVRPINIHRFRSAFLILLSFVCFGWLLSMMVDQKGQRIPFHQAMSETFFKINRTYPWTEIMDSDLTAMERFDFIDMLNRPKKRAPIFGTHFTISDINQVIIERNITILMQKLLRKASKMKEPEEVEILKIQTLDQLIENPVGFALGFVWIPPSDYLDHDHDAVFHGPKTYGLGACNVLYKLLSEPYNVYSPLEIAGFCRNSKFPQTLEDRLRVRPSDELRPFWFLPSFIVVIPNALITSLGHVRFENQVIQLYGSCHYEVFGDDHAMSKHEEVFILGHYWGLLTYFDRIPLSIDGTGDNYYHALVEDLPRFAYFFDYLMENPHIKLWILEHQRPRGMLKFFGFDDARIISGAMNAEMAYLPAPIVFCGAASLIQIRKFRQILVRRLFQLYTSEQLEVSDSVRTVVIVKRTGVRSLVQHEEIKAALEQTFPQLRIVEFRDDPAPSMQETFRMFYQADMVIAPHGAGLSNMVACREGTIILEFLSGAPETNPCYTALALQLGLNYFGVLASIQSSYYGQIHGDVDDAVSIVRQYLLKEEGAGSSLWNGLFR